MRNRALRIAMFSDSALPVINGVSISVDALIQELRNQGHSVHLFAAKFPRHQDSDPNTYRLRSMNLPLTKNYPVAIPPYHPALRHFRRFQFDIIHTHTPFILGMVGLRWAESHDIPIVSTYHTLYDRYAHYIPILPRRYVRFRIAKHTNFYYNRVAHVITPTDASEKWLLRHSVFSPTTVIPTGTLRRLSLDRTESRTQLGLSPDTRMLLYVGRLAQEKNLTMLIRSVHRVLLNDPKARFWLVGDGPYRDECVRLARSLGVGDRIRFVGFVERSEVDRYYAAADLFVFASISETQGLVIQEAMTYGLPTVAVIGGGASSSIVNGVNGIVVRNDAETMATEIYRVLHDEQLCAVLSDNAARSGRNHGMIAMANQVLDVYREVLDRHVDGQGTLNPMAHQLLRD